MKRFYFLIFSLGIVFLLCSCSSGKDEINNVTYNVDLGPKTLSESKVNDTEKVSTYDNPLELGDTITLHTSCAARIDGDTVDMYTFEFTPISYEQVGDNAVCKVRIHLLSFDNDNEQAISVIDILDRSVTMLDKDKISYSCIANEIFKESEYDEAYKVALSGMPSHGGFDIRAGSDFTCWIVCLDVEATMMEVTASTYISWGNQDEVHNYYKLQ